MAQERAGAATVIAQEGDRVQIEYDGKWLTVPMRGFPDGFKLVPGRLVVLVDEPTGPVARPLVRVVRAVTSEQLREATSGQMREAAGGSGRGALEHEGRRLELQEGTVFDEPQPGVAEARASEDNDVWIVERADGDPTDQVIAVRRSR